MGFLRLFLVVGILMLQVVASFGEDHIQCSRNVVEKYKILDNNIVETLYSDFIYVKSKSDIYEFGQYKISNNDYFQDIELLEAYDKKADGRIISISNNDFIETKRPDTDALGIYEADAKILTVAFPDVAIGDRLHVLFKQREKRKTIFNDVFLNDVVPDSDCVSAFTVTLDAPKDLNLKIAASGFVATTTETNDRKLSTWTLGQQAFHTIEPGELAAIEHEPHLIITSDPSWDSIGEAIYRNAAPTSVPTKAIRDLADQITDGKSDHQDQARAIFDWVTNNIRYFTTSVGQNGWVPHQVDVILANRYGDCKDQANLARALLAAKGIAADYVLINMAPTYHLWENPTPWFDHMILYLPEFDRFVDPTTPWSPFDHLPFADTDKNVVVIDEKGTRTGRTPAMTHDTNIAMMMSDVTLRPDGTTFGTTVTSARGTDADLLREKAFLVGQRGEENFGKSQLNRQNWRGKASVEGRDPVDHSDPYSLKATFDLENNFLDEDTNDNAIPIGPRLIDPSYTEIAAFNRNKYTKPFVCHAETYTQITDFHLPDGVTITNIPKDIAMDQPLASFSAHYQMNGQTLHLERRFVSRLPRSFCTPDDAKALASITEAAFKDASYRPQFAKATVK